MGSADLSFSTFAAGASGVFGLIAVQGMRRFTDAMAAMRSTAFSNAFRERQGSLTCRELLGCDVSTPEGATAAREAGLFQTKCVDFVRCAAELVEDTLPGA